MDDFLLGLVGGTSGIVSYALVFGILLACGLGVPLPEDISLVLGGFLVFEGRAQLLPMMATGYLGIIAGDSLIFYAGRRVGSQVGLRPGLLRRVVTPAKRARVGALFKKHGEKIVLIARFLPGVRAVTYFTAGSVGMKYSHFIFFDSVAALASAPGFVFLGYKFGGELEQLFAHLREGQRGVLAVMAFLAVGWFFYRRWRSKREAAAEQLALHAESRAQDTRVSVAEVEHPGSRP
jgi:membrane protein DedA with SNARE-associated domain